MKILELKRFAYSHFGTFGTLRFTDDPSIHYWYSVERRWQENQSFVSCIPEGVYLCKRFKSEKYGDCFEVCNVPDRYAILFHVANTEDDLQGCIGLGDGLGHIKSVNGSRRKWAVKNSKKTMKKFMKHLEHDDQFVLHITSVTKKTL